MSEREVLAHVKSYVEAGDSLKDLNKSVKNLRKQRKEAEDAILSYMEHSNVAVAKIGSVKLIRKKRIKKSPITKKTIQKFLLQTKGSSVAQEMMKELEASREETETEKLCMREDEDEE